jgi:TolB-like protein/class 3 adenylate cyclase/Flp pilus assembly protein TadD
MPNVFGPNLMSAEVKQDHGLQIAHILFIDIVGYSKLLSDKQRELFQLLNELVRSTAQFRAADVAGKLVRLPTGDGMVLAFFTSVDAPVRCAQEIGRKLREHPQLPLRMGINSGPVDEVLDVDDRRNVTGAGINLAQRVMDYGDAGHILLSRRVADDLAQYREWQPFLHDLGEAEVKHGVRVALVNFFSDGFGNSKTPVKIIRAKQIRRRRLLLWLSAVLLFLLLASVGSWIWTRRLALTTAYKTSVAGISQKSIAVLPFENLSAEKENAFFADGVQNEILTNLAKIADLKVISRASVMVYKVGNPRNLRDIGQQLGVAHVLEGSVQRAGGKVRVSAQLIDARTDKHLWASTYDRDLADVFAIETELAQTIAGELQAKLTSSEKAAIEEKPTQDLVAYEFYARAVSLIYNVQVPSGPVDAPEKALSEAVDLLNKAVARDPNFFLAYCQLAFAHDLGDSTPASLALAKAAIDAAFRLRPNSGEAHLALGWHLYLGYADYDRARAELALAQQSLPNNPRVYHLAGRIDRRQGRWADAIHNLERACDLDPRNLPYLIYFGATYLWLHDYDQHAKVMDRIVALHPERRPGRLFRASIDVYRRADTGPLRAEIESILTNEPGSEKDPFVTGQRYTLALYDRDWDAAGRAAAGLAQKNSLEWGFAQLGRDFWVGVVARLKGDETSARAAFTRARAQQEEEIRNHPDEVSLLSDLGLIDAGLGRKEEALNEGRRAMELARNVRDAFTEESVKFCFAIICTWTGERELALGQLEALSKNPGTCTYGNLRLNPMWDPLRGDPRFEKIVASLAPKK